jgi:N-acetylmuramoyl-L-alanine amidase
LIASRALLRCAAVTRFRFVIALLCSAIICTLLQAQLTDEEKRTTFLKTKSTASADPDESPTPKPKHKSKSASPTPKPKPKPSPKETPESTPRKSRKKKTDTEETPKPKKKKKSPTPSGSPKKKISAPRPSETPVARQIEPAPHAIAVPGPSGPPVPRTTSAAPVEEPEQLTIQKYGYEKPRSFWSRLFGGGGNRSSGAGYRYLSASVRSQIDHAPVTQGRWQFIVVHNSGTRQGNASVFDYYHRHVRRMQNGLAYHFVIGNGTSTGNGQIEVGDRWRRQINGGHVHSDYLNNIALGICLVGDFNRDQPTRAQLDSCEELIRYLRQRCGKVGDHYPIVKPHREVNPPRWATDCPGDVFPYSWFRRF